MTRVKLCGITSNGDRDAAVAAGADAVGVIVDVNVETPREISAERAAKLVDGVPPFVTTVLVTMPDSVEEAVTLLDKVGADAIQVHSTLPPEYVGGLRERINGAVLAAVGPDADLAAYADAADALLVDSVDSEGGGGTGETQDWEHTRKLVADIDTPVVLAGGLTPENVGEAVRTVDPFAVDVASGVERDDASSGTGRKDPDAVAAFVENASRTRGTPTP